MSGTFYDDEMIHVETCTMPCIFCIGFHFIYLIIFQYSKRERLKMIYSIRSCCLHSRFYSLIDNLLGIRKVFMPKKIITRHKFYFCRYLMSFKIVVVKSFFEHVWNEDTSLYVFRILHLYTTANRIIRLAMCKLTRCVSPFNSKFHTKL